MISYPINTEDKRRELLQHYMLTEPEIYVDKHPYIVSVSYDDPNFVRFYAVSKRTNDCGALTKVTRRSWEQIDSGLCMACLLNDVLHTLEQGIAHTGGRMEAALL